MARNAGFPKDCPLVAAIGSTMMQHYDIVTATDAGQEARGVMKDQQIIDGLKVVCQCKGIRKSAFRKQIKAGKRTVEELRKATGAGRGSCKGKQCTPKIRELLKE
jgi:NAD(P)H-nitrite reductase large subunit